MLDATPFLPIHFFPFFHVARDVIEGAVAQAFQALIFALTGETDKAISEVERLLTTPLPSITPTNALPFPICGHAGNGIRFETIRGVRKSSPVPSRSHPLAPA